MAHIYRGAAHAALGRLETALADLDEAIRLQPNLIPAYRERSAVRKRKGDVEGASRDLAEAARLAARIVKSANAGQRNERR